MPDRWYVTFGVGYAREPHPFLNVAHPDCWVEVVAPNEGEARYRTIEVLGRAWSHMYSADEWGSMTRRESFYPGRCVLVIDDVYVATHNLIDMTMAWYADPDMEFEALLPYCAVLAKARAEAGQPVGGK